MQIPSSPDDVALAALIALMEDTAGRAQGSLPPLDNLDEDQSIYLSLFVSTFEVLLGIVALLRERLSEEARMLSRSLLDDTAKLVLFATDKDHLRGLLLQFRNDSLKQERFLMLAARKAGEGWADEGLLRVERDQEEIAELSTREGIELQPLPKPREMFELLGQPKLYYWYARASHTVHSSAVGLSSRFKPVEGGPVQIPLGGDIDQVVQVGAMAVQAFTMANVAFADLMDSPGYAATVADRETAVRLSSNLLEKATAEARPSMESGDPRDAGDPKAP